MSDPASPIDRDFARTVDWNLLKVFLEIVRADGIGAAARALNKQQPSISAALKRLEDQLGARLFERSTSGIRITPAGKALQALCEDMFEHVRMAQHQVAQATRQVSGMVRIQLISSIVCPELDDAIASFHRRHPGIAMELRVSPWRGVLDALARAEVEVGIGYEGAAGPELVYEPMFVETQQLFCARAHPLYGRKVARLDTLRHEGFVLTGADEPDAVTRLRSRHGLGTVRADPSRDTATQLFLDEMLRRLRAKRS